MKTIKIVLGEQEAIVQIPDDIELTTSEAGLMVAVIIQEQISRGNVKFTVRRFPCFYCGRDYKSQLRLVEHLKTHDHEKKLKALEGLGKKVEK